MSEDGNGHFGAVDETTKRLVGRCGRVPWLRREEEETSSPQSPTKLKQRLLSVSLPQAMESSLSVMEVASQKSKPGVKTPSRAGNNETGKGNEDADGHGDGVVVDNAGDDDAVGNNNTMGIGVVVEKSPFEVEGEA